MPTWDTEVGNCPIKGNVTASPVGTKAGTTIVDDSLGARWPVMATLPKLTTLASAGLVTGNCYENVYDVSYAYWHRQK